MRDTFVSIGQAANFVVDDFERRRAHSAFVSKAIAHLRIQPHGANSDLARQIGVEWETVRAAREILASERAPEIPVRTRKPHLLAAEGSYARARQALLETPNEVNKRIAARCNSSETTVCIVRKRLRQEGKI
jgi:hypothetical protein